MKILVLGSRGFPNVQGGVEACCENLYPSIAAHGHEVIVISRSCYTGKKEYVYKGIRIIPFWAPKNMKLEALVHTFLGTLAALQFKPDIIHYHAIGPSFFVPLAKFFGFRVVATHHGFDYDRAKWGIFAKKFLQWSERHLCRAHAVISVARYIQESLQKRFHTNSIVIVNGALKKNILPFGEYCKRWNLEKKKYFLFTGRLV
ncbi:MAG: glycosyltransferase family 4 protein, partial [Candidatus Aureabacteria bacterium]|nr:glycosyltransferase family 4 protein [Candidatus Auribacterota bacterium]